MGRDWVKPEGSNSWEVEMRDRASMRGTESCEGWGLRCGAGAEVRGA